jgi:phospholipase/carboxylesterase
MGVSSSSRDGLLYVPATYRPDAPLPLLVALHGAGGRADNWRSFTTAAEDRGLILAVPESRGRTWDRVNGPYGPDVAFIDRALAHVFERCRVDPSRLALGGFSDGASYALSLGLANGDLFSHVIAFSPGFADVGSAAAGTPRVFISHGVSDSVLPVRLSRDGVVPLLRREGYDLRYEEFEGGHEVPAEVGAAALDWLMA